MASHIETTLRGRDLLRHPILGKGTAFSHEERHDLNLDGLLPHEVETIDHQLERVHIALDLHTDDLAKHIYLRQVQERSRIIFYRYLLANMEEVLPIVYTPTVGQACEQFSRIYRIPHGLFVAYPDIDRIDHMIANYGAERIQV
ncbi:MAG: NAD-dependent malic enzyme, partial [Acidimicrobiia bacterium]|nr:NAD-dependent malic enzyme [Acidimicrobiia bacterium]